MMDYSFCMPPSAPHNATAVDGRIAVNMVPVSVYVLMRLNILSSSIRQWIELSTSAFVSRLLIGSFPMHSLYSLDYRMLVVHEAWFTTIG